MLLFANAECLDTHDMERQRHDSLEARFEDKIKESDLSNSSTETVRKHLKNDQIGRDPEELKTCLSNWPESEQTKVTTWDQHNPLIIAIVTALLGAKAAEFLRSRSILNNGRKSLLGEMQDITCAMKSKRPFTDPRGGPLREYVILKLRTTAFDSLTSSGHFAHFSPKTQNALDKAFFHIKEHNQKIDTLNDLHLKLQSRILKPNNYEIVYDMMQELASTDKVISESMVICIDLLTKPPWYGKVF